MERLILILFSFWFFLSQGFSQSNLSCGNSLRFNAQDNGVKLPLTNEYYSGNQGGYTWECWFKFEQAPAGTQVRPLISAMDGVLYEDLWLGFGWNGGLFNEPVSRLVFKVDGPNSTVPTMPSCSYAPSGGFQPYIWYHVAGVMDYNAHQAILYVNGQQVAVQIINTQPITRIIPTFLSYPQATSPQISLYGKMDEVRIWNRPLGGAEIASVYGTCLSGAESGLALYYHCNEGSGTQVTDLTANQRNASYVNVQGWTSETAPLTDMSCLNDCMCPALDAGSDANICSGQSVLLAATTGFEQYSWAPSTGLSDPSVSNPVASPSVTTTYTVTGTTLGPELVVNGDFSQGNTGFVSGHDYTGNYNACNYYVAPTFFLANYPGYNDHTPTSDNMYMSIDGCTYQNYIWAADFIVEPYTDYRFSFWATRAAVAQPIFQIEFFPNATGSVTFPQQVGIPDNNGVWTWDEYGVPVWNSGPNNFLTIQITNIETNGMGVDFGIDDLSFRKTCIKSDVLTVAVNPSLVMDIGPDIGWCTPSSHTFTASAGFLGYQWSDGSTDPFLTVTAPGTYWVTGVNICSGTLETDSVIVSLSPHPVLDLGEDSTVCPGQELHFNAGQFDSYLWTGTGLSCTDCASPVALPPVSGVYELTVANAQGCTATDNIWITVASLVEIEMADVSSCSGDSVHLSAPDGFVLYEWTGDHLSCHDCQSQVVNPAISGEYTLWAETTEGCTAFDTVYISVLPKPEFELGENRSICKGNETHLEYLSPGPGSYQWSPATGLSCSDCQNPVFFPEDSTLYVLTVVSVQGCSASDSIHIFVRDDLPQHVLATVTDATCDHGGTVVIEAVGNGIDELQYNLGQHGYTSNPLYQDLPLGNYLLSVRNGPEGCPYNTVVVVEGEEAVVFIPNVFTPDGNEFNNTWNIQGNCITEISCRVLNRWGEQVAQLTDLSHVWDGTFNGQLVQDGVYTYIVEVTYSSYYKEILTGFVAVLR